MEVDIKPWTAKRNTALILEIIGFTPEQNYSTVTDFAKFLGLSTSVPRAQAVW